jgi:acyl-CoA thioesterase-1
VIRRFGKRAEKSGIVLILIGALIIVMAVILPFFRESDPPPASEAAIEYLANQPTTVAVPEKATLDAVPDGASVLVFGDSYTAGYGANPREEGYAYKLGPLTGWDVAVEGIGSTGYLSPGNNNQGTFKQRIEGLPYGDEFDLVILQGGSNDQNEDIAGLAGAIESTVGTIRTHYPSAQLVMVGPVSLRYNPPADKATVNEVIATYAADNDIPFISPIGERWFTDGPGDGLINTELGHPNNKGYDLIAQLMSEALQPQS